MSALPNQVYGLPVSFDSYIRSGWSLVPIPPNTKGPNTPGWNRRENALKDSTCIPPGYGVGLAHAYSGTMALDIDNWDEAAALLSSHGIDLQSLYDAPDAVTINSGRAGRGKLIYAMPFGMTLPSKRITNTSGQVVYELRCAASNGTTVQCVLPPSIHPETKQPYQWGGRGKWQNLPTIPFEVINLWTDMLKVPDSAPTTAEHREATSADIRSALFAISPDCSREQWLQVGMALHSTDKPASFDLWNEWSATAKVKYKGENDLRTVWKSFKTRNDGITIGSLFHIAIEHGWKPPEIDVTALFKANAQSHSQIMSQLRDPSPEVDLSIFPTVLRRRAEEVAQSTGCDPLVPLFAGLGAVCAAVDARSRLDLDHGFSVPPILWLMTIGDPAEKKSPGAAPMLAPLSEIQKEDIPRYRKELLLWEAKDAMYQASKKAYMVAAASNDQLLRGDDFSQLPPCADTPPTPPVSARLVVEDITSQKLVRLVHDRQRGVLCHLDEMAGWINKLTDRKSGEDRSSWTKGIECGSYTLDRVGEKDPIMVDNYAVAIFGNVQPSVYREAIKSLSTDGLVQRFIPGIVSPKFKPLERPIPMFMQDTESWSSLLRTIYHIPTQRYKLSTAAYEEFWSFREWYNEARQVERVLDASNTFLQAYGKLEGLLGRVAFILHLIDNPTCMEVEFKTMRAAVMFVRGYVVPAMRHAFSEIGGSLEESLDVWVMRHIAQLSGITHTVTLSDLKRSARRKVEDMKDGQVNDALKYSMLLLERNDWVVKLHESHARTEWAINPSIAEVNSDYRRSVIKAKQKRLDDSRAIVLMAGKYTPRQFTRGYDPEIDD